MAVSNVCAKFESFLYSKIFLKIILQFCTFLGDLFYYYKIEWATKLQSYDAKSPKNIQNIKIILRHILKYKKDSNVAHTLLRTIKDYDANPSKNFFFDHVNEKSTSKVLRENRGDLFVGLLYTMEASGPFVAIRHLLLLTNKAWYFPDR